MKKMIVVFLGLGLLVVGGVQAGNTPVTNQDIVTKIKNGDVNFIKKYFTDHKKLIRSVIWRNNAQGQPLNYTPFIVAAVCGQPKIMTALYDINPRCIHDLTAGEGTPFAEAAWYNQVNVLNWYQNKFPTGKYSFQYYLNKSDGYGNTPLDEAMKNNSTAAIQWLQTHGAVRGSKK